MHTFLCGFNMASKDGIREENLYVFGVNPITIVDNHVILT
jgi:hypothetical protein